VAARLVQLGLPVSLETRNTTLWFAIGGLLSSNSELAWVVEIRIGLRLFWYSLGKLVIERDGGDTVVGNSDWVEVGDFFFFFWFLNSSGC
jgi:hypothetical protein